MSLFDQLRDSLLGPDLDEVFDRIPTPVGSFHYDAWGYNKEKSRLAFAVAKKLYDDYFRVTANGLEHVPATGRVLIIGNHSGQLPMDGVLVAVALATNPDGPRAPRAMVERFFPTVPFVGNFLNQIGAVTGDPANCARMLESEGCIIVFPEGVRGSGKLYKDRYQLQRFGNGFMHLAINHRTPVVPVGIVGCEETMPSVANLEPVAKLLGLPYLPVTTPVPLPARVYLEFGAPMLFDGDNLTEAEVGERVEQVKQSIRGLIRAGLERRESVF